MPSCCGRDTPDWRTYRAFPVSSPRPMQKLHMNRFAASPRQRASARHDNISRANVEEQTRSAAGFVSFAKACSGKRRHATAGKGGVVRGFRPAVPDSRIRMVRTCPLATGAAENAVQATPSCTLFAAELRRKSCPKDTTKDACAATRNGWRAWPVLSAPALIEASRVGLRRSAMHNARTCAAPCRTMYVRPLHTPAQSAVFACGGFRCISVMPCYTRPRFA